MSARPLEILYVDAETGPEAAAWLAARGAGGGSCVLVSAGDTFALAAQLAARHGLEVWPAPPTPKHPTAAALRPLRARIKAAAGPVHGVVLGAPDDHVMLFRQGEVAPAYNRFAPALRLMHHLGVRDYRLGPAGQPMRIEHHVDDFEGRHQGQPAYVIGNGPSLNDIPMEALRDKVLFGSNRCFLGYEKWGFSFPYWAITDRLQIEMYADDYITGCDADSYKFFPFEYAGFWSLPNACPVDIEFDIAFGAQNRLKFPLMSSRSARMHMGFTVTNVLIQLAVKMGCNPVILLGIDHNYPITRLERAGARGPDELPLEAQFSIPELVEKQRFAWDFWESKSVSGSTHFSSSYSANKVFVPPRTARAETAYHYARRWAAAQGVDVVNATPGTHLDAFPCVSFDSVRDL